MKKIAVTGGAGFIGSNLVERLLSKGHEVTVVDDLSTGLKSNLDLNKITFHELSLTNRDGLVKALNGVEAIVHLGARGSVPRSLKNPIATHDVNATGTLNVLEAARSNGAQVIFSSSSSVYGSYMTLPKNEDMVLRPLTPYAASKMSGEALSLAYAKSYELPVSTFRFFNIFGPWQRPDHEYAAVLPKWISKCIKGDEIEIFGDGLQTRDFTYVGTVVNIILSCISKKILHPEPVNLAYGNSISLNQVLELMKLNFPTLKVKYLPPRKGDVLHSKNDPKLIQALYPDIVIDKFEVSLQKTIDWFKN